MLPLEHSLILLTFIKLPFVIKIFVLFIFEWPFYTGFTVLHFSMQLHVTRQVSFVIHNCSYLDNSLICGHMYTSIPACFYGRAEYEEETPLSICIQQFPDQIVHSHLLAFIRTLVVQSILFTINLHESIGPSRERNVNSWISNRTHNRLHYWFIKCSYI